MFYNKYLIDKYLIDRILFFIMFQPYLSLFLHPRNLTVGPKQDKLTRFVKT